MGAVTSIVTSTPAEAGPVFPAASVAVAVIVWLFSSRSASGVKVHVPPAALVYSLTAGLGEMLVLGMLYGLTLKPRQ